MSYWQSPEDQTKPCRNACGREVSIYNKGMAKDYCSDDCYEEAYKKSLKDDGVHAKWSAEDLYTGKNLDDTALSQNEYRIASLKQAMGKAQMIGDTHQAAEAARKIAEIQGGSL